jgi:hypothetical protein
MREGFEFTFTDEPMTRPEFMRYLEFIGSFSPPNMTRDQVRMLLAVLMKNYAAGVDDVEELDHLAMDAVETAIQAEMQTQLDMAVGPEDGVN